MASAESWRAEEDERGGAAVGGAAKQEYARAQYNLGVMYHQGEGVEQDYSKARDWYEKAAKQGDANAQYNLGAMYHQGQGVKQDYSKAREWYEKAAKQGDAEAQCNLGAMYEFGMGVEQQSDSAAMRWYGKAAAQGHEKAQENINDILARASEKRRTKAVAQEDDGSGSGGVDACADE